MRLSRALEEGAEEMEAEQKMISGMAMMLIIAVVALVGFFGVFLPLWAMKDEA